MESHMPTEGFSTKDRKALSQKVCDPKRGWSAMTDFERARWHAYIRVFRNHNGYKTVNPCDPNDLWHNTEYDAEAERIWEDEHRPARRSELLVRDGFENLRVRDWTIAEVNIMMRRREEEAKAAGFGEGMPALMKLARANIEAAQSKLGTKRGVAKAPIVIPPGPTHDEFGEIP